MKMPGLHGLEVLSHMADKQITTPVIICSAYDQLQDEFVVRTYPNLRYLVKPVAPEALVSSIRELLAPKPQS
jgi:DNA-binding response OmpR family regulator